ncbi:MAG: ATP-binding cassette domain-containing protein [Dehalococcoidia bacterium]|nr:ATP-binding cassette domain-containing protein [Dehalococcoidia bacterium]
MASLNVQQLALRARGLSDEAMSFTVRSGQIAALFGRPDSGIREVLRIIAGLSSARGGDVRLDDVPLDPLPAHRRRIGFVQRDSVLFPGTVQENVAFGLKQMRWPKEDRSRRIAEVLELVGMTGAEADRAERLTEGERARVLLARAIAPRPSALLVESPTWYVPDVDRIAFRGRLREVFQSLDIPILISTNDVQDAVGIADDLHVLHEGRLRQSGSVSRVLAGPSSIEVAELVGYVTLIRGEVSDGWILEPGAGAIEFPAGFPLQGSARALAHPAVMLGVPEDSGLGCGVAGTIERVRAIGPTHLLDLRVGERTIEVRWEWDLNPPAPDEVIAIAVTPGTLRFFNESPGTRRGVAPLDEAGPARAPERDDLLPALGTRAGAAAALETEPEATPAAVEEPASEERPADESTVDEPTEDASRIVEVREFTPSAGLLADPPPAREESAPIAYDPDERVSDFSLGANGAPAPAPAPPRSQPRDDTSAPPDDAGDGVELMAPWLQVSKPQGDEPPSAAAPPDPHRGMPLD